MGAILPLIWMMRLFKCFPHGSIMPTLSREWVSKERWALILNIIYYIWYITLRVLVCFCFICLRSVSCGPKVASFSGMSFLYCTWVFSNVYLQIKDNNFPEMFSWSPMHIKMNPNMTIGILLHDQKQSLDVDDVRDPIIMMGWHPINWFNPSTFLSLSQARTWILFVVCYGLFVFNDLRWDIFFQCVDIEEIVDPI